MNSGDSNITFLHIYSTDGSEYDCFEESLTLEMDEDDIFTPTQQGMYMLLTVFAVTFFNARNKCIV